jgi:hypothetical protein
VLWATLSWLSGQREPWDVPAFWMIGYPLAIAFAFVFGILWPARSWLWGLIIMMMMMPVMAWNGSGLSLLPLGFVAILVLSLLPCKAAVSGGKLSLRMIRD